MGRTKKSVEKTQEAKVEKQPKGDGTHPKVLVESADGQVLSCTVNGEHYEGVSFKVAIEKVDGVRETLTRAGFLLK